MVEEDGARKQHEEPASADRADDRHHHGHVVQAANVVGRNDTGHQASYLLPRRCGPRHGVFALSVCLCVRRPDVNFLSDVVSSSSPSSSRRRRGPSRRCTTKSTRSTARFQSSPIVRVESFPCTVVTSAGWQATPCDPMWRVAVWQLCELLYISYLLTYILLHSCKVER